MNKWLEMTLLSDLGNDMENICDWYTFVTPQYKTYAKRLQESTDRFVNIIQMKNHHDWMANCMSRCKLLLDKWTGNKAIGILDADIVFRKNASMLWTGKYAETDIVIRDRGPCITSEHRFCAGIIRFQNTDLGKQTLQRWAKLCTKDEEKERPYREQHYLYRSILDTNPRVYMLGAEWDCIPPHDQPDFKPSEDSIVVHLPASRVEKEKVSASPDW